MLRLAVSILNRERNGERDRERERERGPERYLLYNVASLKSHQLKFESLLSTECIYIDGHTQIFYSISAFLLFLLLC